VLTFGELATEYINGHAKVNKRSWQEDDRQLKASLLPKWKTRPAAEISADDLLAVLNAKVRAGAPVAANRLRALVSRIFTYRAEQRLVPPASNPVIGVKKPTKEAARDRVLTDDEIRRVWGACVTQNAYVCAWFRLRLAAVWVFPKSFMGDYKHVGRRLAQSTRANIIAEPKADGKARDRADIRGHDLRRTAATLMASGGVPRFVISRILNHSEERT
jgi:integrase